MWAGGTGMLSSKDSRGRADLLGSPTRKGTRRWGGYVLLAIVFAYAAGFFAFVMALPRSHPRGVQADGVVALTGGTERLDAAAALFESGVGKRLLITGVHPTTTKLALKRLVHGGRRFDCCVDLGFQATNTHGNAAEAAQWARAHDYHSLVIVTANYHMPRSLTEFSAEMPHVKLIAWPVPPGNLHLNAWWRSPVALSILQWEYTKYLGSVALTSLFHNRDVLDRSTHDRRTGSA